MLVDISVPLHPGLPHWPRQAAFGRDVTSSVNRGDRSTVSTLTVGAHGGTHFDAPVHFVKGGATAEALDLEACVGPAYVADMSHVEGHIRGEDLEAAGIPEGTVRLLSRTRNSGWSGDSAFREDFCAYDASGAEWVVSRGIRLLGIDYLSIEPFGSGDKGNPTHRTLLEAGIVVLEGLDLAHAEQGEWELIALPLRVVDGDGAPGRAILRR